MKLCYMLTTDERSYLKHVIINTLRLTSKCRNSFKYLTNLEIKDTSDYVYCKIFGENTIDDIVKEFDKYGRTRPKKLPVTWFYLKEDNNFEKLLEELTLYTVANYMNFEKAATDKKLFEEGPLKYCSHTALIDFILDEKLKDRTIPSDEIKDNFKKVVKMIDSLGVKFVNERLSLYNVNVSDSLPKEDLEP